jgi:hypothetical protein
MQEFAFEAKAAETAIDKESLSASNRISEQLLRFLDRGGAQLAIHELGAVNESPEFLEGLFSRSERFLATAEFLIGKIAHECVASLSDA